jgi:hypothetical protein
MTASTPMLDAFFRQFMETGLRYFLPGAVVEVADQDAEAKATIEWCRPDPVSPFECLSLVWLGSTYRIRRVSGFSEDDRRFIGGIGRVLSIRYRVATHPILAAQGTHLYRGLIEDRYVSAYLDSAGYRDPESASVKPDRITDAIEVFRLSAMTTYENRRISTGVILFGSQPDACHILPSLPPGALRYTSDLTTTRSFHRLADGLNTLAVVDRNGLLVELVDVEQWAEPFRSMELPAPVAQRYEPHCRATLCGGHICLILTANGEIKAFANGTQVLTFRDGRWRLGSTADCFQSLTELIGNETISNCLFGVALNMVENRRGGLFVVLKDRDMLHKLVAASDTVAAPPADDSETQQSKRRFHYLLRGQNVLALPRSVIETVARIDGAIVIDGDANLLAFGAILQNSIARITDAGEGSRTAAAISASYFGPALKISEDGMVAAYSNGQCLWEI